MTDEDEEREKAEQSTEADELDIELYEPSETASDIYDELLEISAEDLADVSAQGELPGVSDLDALVAEGKSDWVDLPAVCSQAGRSFIVRFREVKLGYYEYLGAQPHTGQKNPAQLNAGGRLVEGEFHLQGYPGCPICGAPGLVVCSFCQTVSCGGAVRETKDGLVLRCSHCNRDGELMAGGSATQVQVRDDRGKKK